MATANFYNEEAAILIQGSWAIAQINGANADFESKCGVFQFPGVERVIAKSDSLAMSSSTKYPEACIAFMKYFTDDTAQKYTAEVGGKIPVTNVQYDESAAPQQLSYVMDVFNNAKGTSICQSVYYSFCEYKGLTAPEFIGLTNYKISNQIVDGLTAGAVKG